MRGSPGYHLGGGLERGVPLGAELAREGLAEEAVGGRAETVAELLGHAADSPPMEVDGAETAVLRDAHGVEAA